MIIPNIKQLDDVTQAENKLAGLCQFCGDTGYVGLHNELAGGAQVTVLLCDCTFGEMARYKRYGGMKI